MSWQVKFSKHAQKDAKRITSAGLKPETQALIEVLANDPFCRSPKYKKLVGYLAGKYSRRTNFQHRLVYEVHTDEKIVLVLRMWSHYE